MSIDQAEVLALLEDGPHLEEELVDWLAQPADVVRFVLKQMKGELLIKRTGVEREWALNSYQATIGRKPLPSTVQALETLSEDAVVEMIRAHGPQRIPTLARLLQVNEWILRGRLGQWHSAGDRIRLIPMRTGKRRYTVELADALPSVLPPARAELKPIDPAARPTRVIDGIEFEIVNDCSGPVTHWPEDALGGGSSLSGESRLHR